MFQRCYFLAFVFYTLATRHSPLLISTSLHQSVMIAQGIPLIANGASPQSSYQKKKHPEHTAACVRMWCIGTLSLISTRSVHKAFIPKDGFTLTTEAGYN